MSEQDSVNEETETEQQLECYPSILETCITDSESPEVDDGKKETEDKDGDVKTDVQKRTITSGQPKKRVKSGAKGKLVRSLAVCEESCLRPEGVLENQEVIQLHLTSSLSIPDDDKSSRDEFEQEKDKNKEKDKTNEKPKARTLSKDFSQEYTDSTGIDLHEFLVNTLKNNPRDRMMLLKIEQEIIDFICDNNNHYKKFPQMSSYQRMLVHRVAAYFGVDHNVDQTGKSVIINKTCTTRIPEQRFGEHIKDDQSDESQKRFILKRDNSSIDKEDNQSVCSQENLFLENRLLDDRNLCNDTQKKRQLFRGNRDGTGKTSGSRQSSSEIDMKWSEQRPWSSTDSDSSNRNLKPAITKTASFGGITVLTRGDSSASNRSTGKLSKTGSESSSSTGSSSSLSRMHQTIQSTAIVPAAPVNSCSNVSYHEGGVSSQAASASTSYILLPIEAAGIPPGSILLNPHTGQPFVNPDGSPAIYNPPSGQQPVRNQIVGQCQQQSKTQQQHSQPQTQTQQAHQHLASQLVTQRDELTSQFNQMNLSHQSSAEASETSAGTVYPSSLMPHPSQQPGYVMQSTNQQLPPGNFTGSGSAGPQPVLHPPPPQGYVQQSHTQMPIYYYPSGQYATSATQQYRPVASVPFNAQRSQQMQQTTQQAGYQTVVSNQQPGFQSLIGMQQATQNQGLMSSQQGNQVQGMMIQYPAMSSYQVPMTQGSQGLPQQSYQQPIMLATQSGQGTLPASGMAVYCNVIPPSSQNSLRLPTPHTLPQIMLR
ncbi:cAMP-regulated phosphoprotein 21 isoform X9 [Protopterus annectens]|uniref:cAMP-regulated phosphoprotein 21 isoform X9 n=1 Tax=Protopterus annectens TaxID=7888 RepID=UPI001CFA55EB|nr:cAMP-regulated phosphoprotein 21 isoform X9 [Protopterus annectens]